MKNKIKNWKISYYIFGILGAWSFINLALENLLGLTIVPNFVWIIFNPASGFIWLVIATISQRRMKKLCKEIQTN